MRVIHIIPSAFDYFNDIRAQAFALLEELHKLGVENEAVTLQYGATGKTLKESVRQSAPSVHSYLGDFNMDSVIKSFADFDIVHLHCPFFGGAGKILRWKKLNPNIPLVITYHRAVRILDVVSLFMKLYNAYYLPKFFKLADSASQFNPEESQQSIAADTLLVYNRF